VEAARIIGDDDFVSRLERLASDCGNPVDGFFGPSSLTWQVTREVPIYLGGMRAVLMQIAHPMVAQGVSDHSDFRRNPLARLRRTFETVHAMVFGMRDTAVDAAMHMHVAHENIAGVVFDYPASGLTTPYRANDPELLHWVYATLVDSCMHAYRTFLPNLSRGQWERYYQESKIFAQLCGVPSSYLHADLSDFQEWMDKTLASPVLAVRTEAHEIAEALLSAPPLRYLKPGSYVLAAGSLPPRLREEFGFEWNLAVRATYSAGISTLRTAASALPALLRTLPVARRATHRCRAI